MVVVSPTVDIYFVVEIEDRPVAGVAAVADNNLDCVPY